MARSSTSNTASGRWAAPERLGRYLLLRSIGAGGMGEVFAAWDPRLEREVAVKVLTLLGEDSAGRALSEARCLARLRHPNVVGVHEVGECGGRVFIVMELIDGPNARVWLGSAARSWEQILDVLAGAGRGLVAIHDAGLHHGDFKPANVLVDRDGRARVVDFGLAGAVEPGWRRRASTSKLDVDALVAEAAGWAAEHLEGPGAPARSDSWTGTGTGTDGLSVAGTVPYMAPERLTGAAGDARSDQFSLCVVLWEAIHGVRPFVGGSAEQLLSAIAVGRVSSGAQHGSTMAPSLARELDAILLRGLEPDPGRRWPTLRALLDALDGLREPARVRERADTPASGGGYRLGLAGALGAAVVLGLGLFAQAEPPGPGPIAPALAEADELGACAPVFDGPRGDPGSPSWRAWTESARRVELALGVGAHERAAEEFETLAELREQAEGEDWTARASIREAVWRAEVERARGSFEASAARLGEALARAEQQGLERERLRVSTARLRLWTSAGVRERIVGDDLARVAALSPRLELGWVEQLDVAVAQLRAGARLRSVDTDALTDAASKLAGLVGWEPSRLRVERGLAELELALVQGEVGAESLTRAEAILEQARSQLHPEAPERVAAVVVAARVDAWLGDELRAAARLESYAHRGAPAGRGLALARELLAAPEPLPPSLRVYVLQAASEVDDAEALLARACPGLSEASGGITLELCRAHSTLPSRQL
ncbi:serine/threonine-protein kinase [Plesiocystis pacifica]|nr:serine/threonine-protein kinase [Plesiocystis pacifica]